ncbi:MAG: HAD family hydrolase, partial [Clostridia bacterium]|nr:HAD family hydrolase [Clostridia bacterium]
QDTILRRFKALYGEHVNDRTAPFDGVPQLMRALRDAGIHIAVNSNKPDPATKLLCRAHYDGVVELALGEQPDIPKKPAPDGAFSIMRAFGAAAGRTLYVGDGDADLRTAENAGIDCAWVCWGYRRRAELEGLAIPHAFDSPLSLQTFILE